jgi:hypothetical protein
LEKTVQTKKSAVDLSELAIGIVILGIAVSIGAVILTNVKLSSVSTLPTYNVVREVVNLNTSTGATLTTTWVKSIVEVRNATQSIVLTSGNYTLTVDSSNGVGTLVGADPGIHNNTNVNVTYTVGNVSDPRFTVPNTASIGLAEYGNWFKILVIVGIASVILGIIFMAFGNRDGHDGAGVGY